MPRAKTGAVRKVVEPDPIAPPRRGPVVIRAISGLVAERGTLLQRTETTAVVRGCDGKVRTWPLTQFLIDRR